MNDKPYDIKIGENYPFQAYHFQDELMRLDGLDPAKAVMRRIRVELKDFDDIAIVDAVVRKAYQEGISDLYLLDSKFIMDAIREKLERENGHGQ